MQVFGNFGEDNYIVYTVKSGDTLDKIAKRYGTTYQAISKTNMLDDPNKIEIGQQLMIYTPSAKTAAVAPSFSFPKMSMPTVSNSMINYALIGGIIALSIPIAIKLRQARKQQ